MCSNYRLLFNDFFQSEMNFSENIFTKTTKGGVLLPLFLQATAEIISLWNHDSFLKKSCL